VRVRFCLLVVLLVLVLYMNAVIVPD